VQLHTPADVRRLADALAGVLLGIDGQQAGPAIALVYAYVVAELGGARDDPETLRQIIRGVGQLARKHGALQ
jgi:hypothetical protein